MLLSVFLCNGAMIHRNCMCTQSRFFSCANSLCIYMYIYIYVCILYICTYSMCVYVYAYIPYTHIYVYVWCVYNTIEPYGNLFLTFWIIKVHFYVITTWLYIPEIFQKAFCLQAPMFILHFYLNICSEMRSNISGWHHGFNFCIPDYYWCLAGLHLPMDHLHVIFWEMSIQSFFF